ncbi:MAG: nicotinate-nucleotide adenylyltransferase [Bacillota bacterium]|nr:nicotinate-nucleotide adenylyltransferase [Bacillota bacterium]
MVEPMLNQDQIQLRGVRRLGLMGGTFDPIHNAHLLLAETALQQFSLEKVVFIPSRRPPHKKSQAEQDAEQRANMTELAVSTHSRFFMSRSELERSGYSYAYDTLLYLRQLLPADAEIFFISGADSVLDVCKWYKAQELPGLCRFIAAARPDYDLHCLEQLPPEWRQVIDVMEIPLLEISSTEIRRRVAAGESIKYLLPEKVEAYIHRQGLYLPEPPELPRPRDRQWLLSQVEKRLSPQRFQHVLGVAQLAEEWARHWKLDDEKAYAAGLLHDILREKSKPELICAAVQLGIPLDQCILDSPVLLHGPVGAAFVKWEWGLSDPEILDAISLHTLGGPEMGRLSKLIFLADICEPGRASRPGLEELRALCLQDLDQAMIVALEQNLEYLEGKGKLPYPGSQDLQLVFRLQAASALCLPKEGPKDCTENL